MPISGRRGWWSTIEVPQGNKASETGSKHHPQARARWHSWHQSNICKYPPSPPFLSYKDSNKVEFLSSQIGLFAIPLQCKLHCKDNSNGVLAFWIAIVLASQRFKWCFGAFRYDGICFANCFTSLSMQRSVDALLSHGVKPTWGFHKVKLRKSDLAARSRLPTLERGRGSSWEPRD